MRLAGRRVFAVVFGVLSLTMMLAGCGGGSPTPVTVTLVSEAGCDGHVAKFADDSLSASPGDVRLEIGDDSNNTAYRSFVSFLLDIPPGATIDSAVLRVYYGHLADPTHDPFSTLGPVLADHVEYGGTLTTAAYDQPALAALGIFSAVAPADFVELDVTACVRADLTASRPRSQFRLRHQNDTNADENWDMSLWESGDAVNAARRPQLIVTYTN
ncbi:MAG: DNRLRE domain-containing protein [Bacteroidota bacterium]